MTTKALERDVLIVACAVSAGIHGALVPEHFAEGTGAGAGFVAATVALFALLVVLTRGAEASAKAVGATAVLLTGLIASYGLAISTGLPALHPQPEPVDGLALATKAIEAIGLLAALHLLWRGRPTVAPTLRQEGTLT